MKIINLTEQSRIYTSNAYLVRGSWNVLSDVNTLVDVGRDPETIERIMGVNTGVGKKRIERVILTHSHYDHASLLPEIREHFKPEVYAFTQLEGVDHLLRDGARLKMGDEYFEAVHVPSHSQDSICLIGEESGVLFSGDTPVALRKDNCLYDERFIRGFTRMAKFNVRAIYPGHGPPLLQRVAQMLRQSLDHARQARAAAGGEEEYRNSKI